MGVVADVQHGLRPNKVSNLGREQHFMATKDRLKAAVDAWIDAHEGGPGLSAVLNLGDSLEGDWDNGKETAKQELENVAEQFDRFTERTGVPVYHVAGNHCMRFLERHHLASRLRIPPAHASLVGDAAAHDGDLYYAASPAPGFRVVALDTCELSGTPECRWGGYSTWCRPERTAALREESTAMCERLRAEAAERGEPRPPQLRRWNGGVSATQVAWLRRQLEDARDVGDRVLVISHHPLGKGSARESALAWNHAELARILDEYAAIVSASICGHDHGGGYAISERGVHYVTMEAMLEASENSFGIITVGDGDLQLHGSGCATSRRLEV